MKNVLIIALIFTIIFAVPMVSAADISEYNITFDIQPDGTVHEKISIMFTEKIVSNSLNYVVLGDVSDIVIKAGDDNIHYTIEKTGSENSVKFVVPEGTDSIKISFTARDIIFTNENVHSFSTELEPPVADKVNIVALLPNGFGIYRNIIFPDYYETLTDGERISLKWDITGKENVMLSFKFYSVHNDSSMLVLTGIVILLGVAFVFVTSHFKRKADKDFLRGFSEDERKVLKHLSQQNICMQKKIEKEFGYSRAKMTRIIKSLESKGLVEKEKVGRTNRIFYKK